MRCKPDPAAATLHPDIRMGHEARFQRRIDTIEQRLATGRYDIIMFGDSITQQWPAELLKETFPERRVLNAGVGGDGASWLLYRLSGEKTEVRSEDGRVAVGISNWDHQKPSLAVLMIGTNDLSRKQPPCDVAAGVVAVADRIHHLYPAARVIVLSLLPRGSDQRALAREIAIVNEEIAAAIKRKGAPFAYVDVHDAILCKPGRQCTLLRPPNFVHLTPEAYALFGAALKKALPQVQTRAR